jgi:hypothetical protein
MQVQLQFNFTFEDYMNGQLLAATRSWWPRLNLFFAKWVIPAIGILNIILAFMIAGNGISWVVFGGMLCLGTYLTLYRFSYRLRLKRCYARTLIGSGLRKFDFTDEMITLEESNAKSEVQWAAVRSYLENKSIFLVFLAPAKMIMVPKRICTESQLSELRELCRRNIAATPLLS